MDSSIKLLNRQLRAEPRPLTINRAFSLTWPAAMLIYWNKRKHLHEKSVQLPEDFVGTPTMAAVSLLWNTNMAAVTSCENALYYFSAYDPRVVTPYNGPKHMKG